MHRKLQINNKKSTTPQIYNGFTQQVESNSFTVTSCSCTYRLFYINIACFTAAVCQLLIIFYNMLPPSQVMSVGRL